MIPGDFAELAQWVFARGYLLMFIGMALEGPWVTAAASFGAALGYFNIFTVFGLSILGDLIPDTIYYSLGYRYRTTVLSRLQGWFKISDEKLRKFEFFLRNHQIKALALFKYTPFLALTGLVLSGVIRTPFRTFIWKDFLVGIPNTLFFMFLGYRFGLAFEEIGQDIALGQKFLLIGVLLVFILYLIYRHITRIVAKKLEQEAEKETKDDS